MKHQANRQPLRGRNVSIQEAAHILSLHQGTVWKWTRPEASTDFPKARRIGTRQLINGTELHAWIAAKGLSAPDDVE